MRKEKQLFNRLLALTLSFALAFTGISFQGLAVQAEPMAQSEEGLILYYDFDQGDNSESTVVSDKTGNPEHSGELTKAEGSLAGTYSFTDEVIFGQKVKAMNLNTKDERYGPYLQLPDGILDDCDSATISLWVKLRPGSDHAFRSLWNFQSDENKYFFLWADSWPGSGHGSMTTISKDGWNSNQSFVKHSIIDTGRWILTTVVMDGTKLRYYENGKQLGEVETNINVKDLGHTTMNYIGNTYSVTDGTTTGAFAEFKIYNRALSADEIAASFNPSDDDIITEDKNAINLGDVSAITKDFKLPSRGVNGSSITWTSENAAIEVGALGDDGYYTAKVTRPANEAGDSTGTLTATVSYGNGTPSTRAIPVTVAKLLSAQEMVERDKEAVVQAVGSLSNVFTPTISLPSVGEWGSSVTWTWEGAPGVITVPGQPGEDGNYTAQVARPAIGSADATGKLKGTLTHGTTSDSVYIDVTVWASHGSATIIDKADTLDVNTLAGHSPSLPNFLRVSYSDGSTGTLKITWPAKIDENQYAAPGNFTVEGRVEGLTEPVTANVTVTEGTEPVKQAVSSSFNLNDISLDKIGEDGSILTQNRERDITYLKLLNNDQMLYNFYKTFGENDKIANVTPLGGWDAPTGLLRGHSTGHYLSALSLAYASTKDPELKAKLDGMVSEMRRLQLKSKGDPAAFETKGVLTANWSKDPNEWGEGFISAYSPDQFALLEQYVPYGSPDSGIWAPYYTLHKLLAGLIDAYRCAGNKEALDTAKALGKWAYNRLRVLPQEQLTKMWDMYIAGEFGGFNESMAQLYIYAKADGDSDADVFLKGAKLFDNTNFFQKLSANIDDIQGRHANQHIPQIIGAIKMYEATVAAGSPEMYYYDVAENFWQMTVSRYAYSTGGVGLGEKFTSPYQQANYIGDRNCETCAAYNMMKLSMMLNNYNPDNAEYMDYYERTLYNQILASQSPIVTDSAHNSTTYMLPICPGAYKASELSDDFNSFTCCHGTGMENHVKYQEAAYAKTASDLYVGLYLPSTVSWDEKGVKVVQETVFPSETTKLTVQKLDNKTAQSFNMKLRVPYWASKGFIVKVNGEVKISDAAVSTYVTLNGIKANDVIEVIMPWSLHLDKTPDTLDGSEVASMMYGPFVMAAQNSSKDWQSLVLPKNLEDYVTISTNEANGFPVLTTNGYNFMPMFAPEFATEAYHTYLKVSVSPEEGVPSNKRKLATEITIAESMDETKYTADSWKNMREKLDAAKQVQANALADQATIDQAANALEAAIQALVKKPAPSKTDKTKLAAAISEAGKKLQKDYTSASWSKMQAALAEAKKVQADASADQNTIDKATNNLNAAIRALVKAPVQPGKPSSVKATWSGAKKVKVTWKSAKNATKYEVYRSYSKTKNYKKLGSTKKLSFTDSKVTPGKTAYYKVIAYNGTTKGAYSSVKSLYIVKAPTSVKAKLKNKKVTVTFKKAKNATGYEIFHATKKNGKFKKAASLKSAKKTFTEKKKGNHYYKVRAYKKVGKKKVYTGFSKTVHVKVK